MGGQGIAQVSMPAAGGGYCRKVSHAKLWQSTWALAEHTPSSPLSTGSVGNWPVSGRAEK